MADNVLNVFACDWSEMGRYLIFSAGRLSPLCALEDVYITAVLWKVSCVYGQLFV